MNHMRILLAHSASAAEVAKVLGVSRRCIRKARQFRPMALANVDAATLNKTDDGVSIKQMLSQLDAIVEARQPKEDNNDES